MAAFLPNLPIIKRLACLGPLFRIEKENGSSPSFFRYTVPLLQPPSKEEDLNDVQMVQQKQPDNSKQQKKGKQSLAST